MEKLMQPWEQRLSDLSKVLTRCGETYFEPDDFRLNVNQFLTIARTVTFIIQKHKHTLPDFDTLYTNTVMKDWANDDIMSWAKNSRNFIEKQGDLELYSTVQLTLLSSHFSSNDINVPILKKEQLGASISSLVQFARSRFPKDAADEMIIKIERRWVANSLKNRELVYTLTYIYSRLYTLCNSISKAAGGGVSDKLPEPTELDPVSNDVAITRYVKVSEPSLGALVNKRFEVDSEFKPAPELIALRDMRQKSRPDTLQKTVEFFSKLAEFNFKEYGDVLPMLMLFDENWNQLDFIATTFKDQAEKYIFWRSVAERAAYQRAFGLVWICECWIRNIQEQGSLPFRELPITGEQLYVIGADVTRKRRVIAWDIERGSTKTQSKLNRLSEKHNVSETVEFHFMDSILEAMISVRKSQSKVDS